MRHHILSKSLINSEYERLDWKEPFGYNGMVRIRVLMDGSCFFHAVTKSYFGPYITGRIDDKPFDKKKFIRKLRKDLSIKLGSRVDPKDINGKTYYETLSRGELNEISKSVPNYSLKNMQSELDSNRPIDNVYNEFISNVLNKDIYILDLVKRDVYITGDDDEILYKRRPSIVILYLPGHYELIGIKENDNIKTLFDPNDNFIQTIRLRMIALKNIGINTNE
uniref:OTU-like cysteine protease n=2 Tax=Pithovirus LCPAC302 TaxID=2506593 RepID=A0A481Z6Q0_9VIRU|nr:MAG: uncharacterized protein LCPAC302_01730 [Pithovirus LCPAC302]